MIILISGIQHSNYVVASSGSKGGSLSVSINTDDLSDEFDPNKSGAKGDIDTSKITNLIVSVVKQVSGVIQLVGGIIMAVSLALFGLYRVFGSNTDLIKDIGIKGLNATPNNTRALLDVGRSIVIGSVLLFSSATIVNFIFNIFFN